MNCQEFDEIVNCLARDQMMEASVKAKAQTHVAGCEACRARLEGERKLTMALRALAAESANAGASAACEASLMKLFDAETSRPVLQPARARRAYALGLVAALFLVTLGVSVWRGRFVKAPQLTPAVVFSGAINTTSVQFPVSAAPAEIQPSRNRRRRQTTRPLANRNPVRSSEEIATDFLPVTYGGSNGFEAGSQIVRVELPRSTLANFGLPVNMDRLDRPVKADVLVGVDGVARAIRFVQ